jgi:hypothetical protein
MGRGRHIPTPNMRNSHHTHSTLISLAGFEGGYAVIMNCMDGSGRQLIISLLVQWRRHTRPRSRNAQSSDAHVHAMENWKRAKEVAIRAGHDDAASETSGEENMSPEEVRAYKKLKAEARAELEQHAKVMDLQYWLEMVDGKHRYGSNLRAYHNEWKKSETLENFFVWLDHGQGRSLDLPTISRQRLDSEHIRYLSREERLQYLVRVDSEGRLCWAKNNERISTTAEFKDSLAGIVPSSSGEPSWPSGQASSSHHRSRSKGMVSDPSSTLSSGSTGSSSGSSDAEGRQYVNQEFTKAKGFAKLKQVSPATILNQLLQRTVRPGTWIFVADTSFRLYVGIKQSGSFQHSSFLHGARISSAGLIKIKNGQLRKLSPLSGHYRPPIRNFRLFVHSLRDAGVDMSRVSISRSYAVLVGLEAYVRTRRKIKHGMAHATHGKNRILHAEEAKKLEEDKMDGSQSSRREREFLERAAKKEEEAKAKMTISQRILHKLHIGDGKSDPEASSSSREGQSAMSEVAPDGKR